MFEICRHIRFSFACLARNVRERYDSVPACTGHKTGTITDRTRVEQSTFPFQISDRYDTGTIREWTLFIPGERSEDNWEGVLKKYGVMERGSEKNGIL